MAREVWGAAPAKSIVFSDPKNLRGVAVHWFGKPRAAPRHRRCQSQLRAVQRIHQRGEFNDIAYNFAVCQHGEVYELRGWNRQTGANGNRKANRNYGAIVVMVGAGNTANPVALSRLRWLIGEYRKRGAGREVRPHGFFTGSTCPGPQIGAWLAAKSYEEPERLHFPRRQSGGGGTHLTE